MTELWGGGGVSEESHTMQGFQKGKAYTKLVHKGLTIKTGNAMMFINEINYSKHMMYNLSQSGRPIMWQNFIAKWDKKHENQHSSKGQKNLYKFMYKQMHVVYFILLNL